MGLYLKCPLLQQHWSLGWGGSFFPFLVLILGYWRLLPCSVIPAAAQLGCFVCQALQGSLDRIILNWFCVTPAWSSLQKENSKLFMDIPKLLQSSGVLTRPWRCYRNQGNLRMENYKEGGKGFGRDLQEEALKIFTQCKQIPGAMKGWNFNLQQFCSRTGVTSNKFRGVASGAWVNIPKIHPQSLSLCQRRGFHSASSS